MTAIEFPENNIINIIYKGDLIGVVTVKEYDHIYEPHVEWNEYATNRGIYNGFLKVIDYLCKIKTVLIFCETKFAKFFDGFCKRSTLRKVGLIDQLGVNGVDGEMHIYQARKKWVD
jgi:hypothetical protein